MISSDTFLDLLTAYSIDFYAGVPDSLLLSFSTSLSARCDKIKNIVCANEGSAVALAAGYHLASNKIPLVYMQNSGLSNAINPLASLCHQNVYSIPLLLLIGWRGQPGKQDEPQHIAMGGATLEILDSLNISYDIFDADNINPTTIANALTKLDALKFPHAFVCSGKIFAPFKQYEIAQSSFTITRAEALTEILNNVGSQDAIVCSTGYIGAEVYTQRNNTNDFLNVGAMGHASQIALGIALTKPYCQTICLDGDGAAIMHLGSLSTNGTSGAKNFKHVILNNGAHDSVGGQSTVGFSIDFISLAKALGYKYFARCNNLESLNKTLKEFLKSQGPSLLEIQIQATGKQNFVRPKDLKDRKDAFMAFLKNLDHR